MSTPKTPEGKLKAECREFLRQQGAYVYSPVPMGYGATTLDDLVCWRGKFFAFEYKRPDKRPEPTVQQKMVMAHIQNAGGIAIAVYEVADVTRQLMMSEPD